MSDRLCIYKMKYRNFTVSEVPGDLLSLTQLSPQDLTSCGGGEGCNSDGGATNSVTLAYQKVLQFGLVTNKCMPYVSSVGITGECQPLCADKSEKVKFLPSNVVDVSRKIRTNGIDFVKREILENGPVTAGMAYYGDHFREYPIHEQVYIAEYVGVRAAHAVKIIGWGSQEQVYQGQVRQIPYWLCQNSWGPDHKPYFKIVRESEFFTTQALAEGHTIGIEDSLYAPIGPYFTITDSSGVQGIRPVDPWRCPDYPNCNDSLKDYQALMKKFYKKGYFTKR